MSDQGVAVDRIPATSVGVPSAVIPPEAPPTIPQSQTSGHDTAALLTLFGIVLLYHAVDLGFGLRTGTQLGAALRSPSLRQVITVCLGFLSYVLFVGERRHATSTLRKVAGLTLGVFTVYIGLYTFLGLEVLTNTIVPTLLEVVALGSAVILWKPWERVSLYSQLFKKLAPALIAFFSVLVVWEVIIRAFNIQQFLLPAPSVIATEFSKSFPKLIGQGWFTFQNALWGFAFGCGAGLIFGMLTARFAGFSRAIMPYMIATNAIPIIALAPLTNQWFGVSDPRSKIAIVTILTFFPVMINTVRGLTSVPAGMIELMRSYASTEADIFRKLRFPVALPYIFSALKVAATLSMIAAIVSEYFGGPISGLGVNIADNAALSKFPLVWSQIVIASALGLAFYFVVSLVERLMMPWHLSFRNQND